MTAEAVVLSTTAVSVAFLHTLLGPDHYVPFVALAKAARWSLGRTILVTIFCGVGHVGSSVILGLVGIGLGLALADLETLQARQGEITAWILIAFGLIYLVWGLRKAFRNRPHQHWHSHGEEVFHSHEHKHIDEHLHPHVEKDKPSLTPWVLFIIFAFGPCETLIPLVMYPAAEGHFLVLTWVVTLFSLVTIGTMLAIVLALSFGVAKISVKPLERYAQALAGFALLASGLAVKFLGL